MNIGDKVITPRFGTVTIKTLYDDNKKAFEDGYTEPTHYRDEEYHIRGKHTGENRMIFATIKRHAE